MKFITEEMESLKQGHLIRSMQTIEGAQGARVRIAGKEVILLCSNNYLGLADHPALKEAAIKAIEKYGSGTGASRLTSGTMTLHNELEEKIAGFKGTEAALVFNSGYTANTSVIPALAGRGDFIFSDRLNHASIVDGCTLSRAEVRRYRHGDLNSLSSLMQISVDQCSGGRVGDKSDVKSVGRRLIATDSVFSMDGDIAPLPGLLKIAGEYDAMLMVDDAHATGVIGDKGRGSVEYFGLEKEDIIQMGTLGKAVGSFGAYVAGNRILIDYLINKARGFVYSTSLPPAILSSSIAALDILEKEPGLRLDLKDKTVYLKERLSALGFDILKSETPIIPILVGEAEKTMIFSARLLEDGVFVAGIRPPTVPEGKSRLRVTVTAAHSYADLDRALDSFSRIGKELCLI